MSRALQEALIAGILGCALFFAFGLAMMGATP
jgi:hypothetical protein